MFGLGELMVPPEVVKVSEVNTAAAENLLRRFGKIEL